MSAAGRAGASRIAIEVQAFALLAPAPTVLPRTQGLILQQRVVKAYGAIVLASRRALALSCATVEEQPLAFMAIPPVLLSRILCIVERQEIVAARI